MDTEIFDSCFFRLKDPNRMGITWEITNRCNLRCLHCCTSATLQDIPGQLSLNESLELVEQIAATGQFDIYISGGEPFIFDGIITIIRLITLRGMGLGIATNGTLITEELAYKLSDLGVNMIHVSLDGATPDIHDAMRGSNGAFMGAIQGIKWLVKAQVPVRVGHVITTESLATVGTFVDLVQSLGVDKIIFSTPQPTGRARMNLIGQLNTRTVHNTLNELKDKTSVRMIYRRNNSLLLPLGYCPGGSKVFHINANGDVHPCSWLAKVDRRYCLGNVKKEPFSRIKENNQALRRMLESRFHHQLCKNCELTSQCYRGCPAVAALDGNTVQGIDSLCPKVVEVEQESKT